MPSYNPVNPLNGPNASSHSSCTLRLISIHSKPNPSPPQAYDLMWELKELFDPEYVLNPGVILNKDPNAHIKFLKPSPAASPLVNRCIECGFCESNCPSRDITLTPRQRITSYREINRLRRIENPTRDEEARLRAFETSFEYDGEATCAADGMCQ